jgi:8-oxo-dGTP pyrophosphatase MutT (NUDIX family)
MLACARREVAEETGLLLQPERCAFIGDVVDPNRHRRQVELVFVARLPSSHEGVLNGEAGAEPTWVSVDDIRHISLRPPIGGFLPAVISGRAPTVPYLGNLWRSQEAIS